MPDSTRANARVILIALAVALTPGCGVSQVPHTSSGSAPLRFNAEWWQHANSDEQQGFIYGYMDCRQPRKAAKASIGDYQDAVSAALEMNRSRRRDAVIKAIEHAQTTLKSTDVRGGETYSGPHGYLDGDWWGSFAGPRPSTVADADRGYLEGYLECSSPPVTPKAVSRYQAAINRHYALGHHDHDSIANVLQTLSKPRLRPGT